MAVTESTYTGNGSTTNYSFTFPYLKTADIKASINGTATTAFTLANATTVQFNTAPANSSSIRIYRETDDSKLEASFFAGSAIKSSDLNDNFNQTLYVTQESNNKIDAAWTSGDETIDSSETWASNNTRVATTGAIDGRIDSKIDTALTTDVAAGNKITVTDNSPGSGQITVALTSGSLVNSDVNASAAIAGTKISPDFGSQNIATTGTVDGRDVSVDGAKLDGIETGATADQTNAEIRAAVEAATDSNVFTDADHSKLNAIEASATADQTAAEIRTLVESASDSNVFTDADHTKLNSVESGATQDQTVSEIKSLIAGSPLDASHLAANSVTTSEIADAELTTLAGMQSGTASILASSTALTATNAEINAVCDGKTVQTTISDTDNSYPTSGAVVDYVAAQIAPLGGLEVIANEDSFPTTQPQSGVVISIADAGGIVVNGSGVSTTARTSGNGSDNVTINGFPSSLHSTTLSANLGLMVSSTGSSNTYTYHKLLGKEDDIKQLSDDINDFNARYRVAASAPSSSLDDGDLWFDTTNDKMKVYNATGSSWDDVASVGDFFINTLSSSGNTGGGSATFNGTAYRFVLSSPPTSAQQLIVSVNGVIQKPNAGSSQPSEGFAISGNDIIFAAAPPSGADYFITTQGSAVSIGTPSDNTISTAKLQNLAVTGDKIATNLDLADNKKIRLGTGNDLEIFHAGAHTKFINKTGQLRLQSADFRVRDYTHDHEMIIATEDGSVDLYYDNSKKFETTSAGATVSGNLIASSSGNATVTTTRSGGAEMNIHSQSIRGVVGTVSNHPTRFMANGSQWIELGTSGYFDLLNDNQRLRIGAGQDLQIYHSGTHSFIKNTTGGLFIDNTANISLRVNDVEDGLQINANGSVELYNDGSKKFETTSTGIKILPGGSTATVNASTETSSDVLILRVNKDGTDATELAIKTQASGGSMAERMRVNATGVDVTGVLQCDEFKLLDGEHAKFGSGEDLRIYHDGSDSYIDEVGTGGLHIKGSGIRLRGTNSVDLSSHDNNENMLRSFPNGAVELYYDNVKQFYTTSTGSRAVGQMELDGGIRLTDTREIQFGDKAGGDLKIYHNGSDSFIQDVGSGRIWVDTNLFQLVNNYGGSTATMIRAIEGGSVDLHYDGTLRMSTGAVGMVVFGATGSGNYCLDVRNASSHGSGNDFIRFKNQNGSIAGGIEHSGSTSVAYNTSSDYRLKENEVAISDGITRLKTLKPYRFNFKSEPSKTVDGFFAHEVTAVPEAITGTKDAVAAESNEEHGITKGDPIHQQIDQSKLVPLLTAALQEAITKIETLETKVAALEAK